MFKYLFVLFSFLSFSLPVSAALDVTAAVTYLQTDVTLGITAVGTALIILAALAMGFRWVKAMFFS